MHYDGMTFRPPYEAGSLLLQVTRGCSHNACTFCSMYREVSFAISPLEEIVDDLAEAAWEFPGVSRVFLVNGDAFCLPADALLNIAEMIHEALPNVRSIGCYARIPNVSSKTDGELAALAAAGYDNINIGVESGLDDVLAFMNKCFTVSGPQTHCRTCSSQRRSGQRRAANAHLRISPACGPRHAARGTHRTR